LTEEYKLEPCKLIFLFVDAASLFLYMVYLMAD